jgi:hypothetical protein
MPPRDLCRGFRECYNAILKAVVANPHVAGFCMGIPTYFLLSALLFQGTMLSFVPEAVYFQTNLSAPYYTILALNIVAWILELIAVHKMLPNLLGICAFCHTAFGSWWFVNFVILFLAGWYYIPFRVMFAVLLSILSPAIIWHITGDVLRAYKKKLIDEIVSHSQALAQQEVAFVTDPEIGQGK